MVKSILSRVERGNKKDFFMHVRYRKRDLSVHHTGRGAGRAGLAPGAGWTIALPGAQSAQLEPGLYGIDARLTVAGGIVITEQTAFISLTRAAVA